MYVEQMSEYLYKYQLKLSKKQYSAVITLTNAEGK